MASAPTETLPSWDLEHLLDSADVEAADAGSDPERVDALIDEADSLAEAFAAEHEGKVAELDCRRAARRDGSSWPGSPSWSGGRSTSRTCASPPTRPIPANGALMQRVSERATAIQTRLIFFELEWVALDDERAEELLAADGLDFCRHHLGSSAATARTCSPSPRSRSSPRCRVTGAAPGAGSSTS